MAYSKYKLGDLIEQYDEINLNGEFTEIDDLQGINSNKYFQECKSNKNDINLYRYRICRHRMFSYNRATSRNGEKISIAFRIGGDCIVSPSYYCFYVKDEEVLCPEYLDIWFKRPVFDRYARFNSWGSATEFFTFDDFCETEIILPPIDEQRKIVHDYQVITDRIELLRKINEKLSAQAQNILASYMEKYEYTLQPLSSIANVIDCLHTKKPKQINRGEYQLIQLDNIRDDGFLDLESLKYMISKSDYENWTRKCEINEGDCVITNVGRMGAVSQAPKGTRAAMGRNMTCIRLKQSNDLQAFLITLLLSPHMKLQMQDKKDVGTIMEALNVKNIPKLLCPIFDENRMVLLEKELRPIVKNNECRSRECQVLEKMRGLILGNLAREHAIKGA